jgi:WD40 repeat protein
MNLTFATRRRRHLSISRGLGYLLLALLLSLITGDGARQLVAAERSPKIVHRLGASHLFHTDSSPHFDWMYDPEPRLELAFSPDGTMLASAHGQVVDIWDTRTGELVQEIRLVADTYLGRRTVTFSADSSEVYTATDRSLLGFRANTGERTLNREFGHRNWQPHLRCDPDGKTIEAVAGNPPHLGRTWSTESRAQTGQWYNDREDSGEFLALSPNFKWYADYLPSEDDKPDSRPQVRVCGVETGEELFRIPAPIGLPQQPDDVALDDAALGDVALDDHACDEDAPDDDTPDDEVPGLSEATDVRPKVAFSADGTTFALFVPSEPIEVWSVSERKRQATIACSADVDGVIFGSGQSLLLVGARSLEIWDVTTSQRQRLVKLSDELRFAELHGNAATVSGSLMAVANGLQIQLVNLESGEVLPKPGSYEHTAIVRCEFDLRKRRLLTTYDGGGARIWDLASETTTARLPDDVGEPTAFSTDGSRLYVLPRPTLAEIREIAVGNATQTNSNTFELWDTQTGKLVGKHTVAKGSIFRFTSDGKLVLAYTATKLLAYELTTSPKPVLKWKITLGQEMWPRGRDTLIESGKTLLWFDPVTGRVKYRVKNSSSLILCASALGQRIAYLRDDRIVVAKIVPKCSRDELVSKWQHKLDFQERLYLSSASADLSPNGKLLAMAPSIGLDVWEIDSGRHLCIKEAERLVRFSPDGMWLATGGRGNTVLIYDVASIVECMTK